MPEVVLFILAIAAASLLWIGSHQRVKVAVFTPKLRRTVGVCAAIFAVLSLARGAAAVGAILGLVSVALLSVGHWSWTGRSKDMDGDDGATTRIETETLDASLDHATGAIHGRVRRGFFLGRSLESLKPVELAHLWSDCRFADPMSAQIVEAYLDRVHPTWRADMDRQTEGVRPDANQQMSRNEALDILGLKPDASETEIRHAHRELMIKLHPDKGGSHTLAAKVNEAKETLLSKG